jgi:GxxExxY protein
MNRQDAKDAKTCEPDSEFDRHAHAVIGAAIEVHRWLGPGFLESIYEEALCIELEQRGIPFTRQAPVAIRYKDRRIGESRIDLLVAGCLVVELKTVERLAPIHIAQALSYLKALHRPLALVINFNVSTLRSGIKRVVLTDESWRAWRLGG